MVNNFITTDEKVGHTICKYRKKKHLTQQVLAYKISVESSTISRYENGNRSITVDTLCLLHVVLGDDFFTEVIKYL